MARNQQLILNVFDPEPRVKEDDILLTFGDPPGLHALVPGRRP